MKTPEDSDALIAGDARGLTPHGPSEKNQQIDDLLSIMAGATDKEVAFEFEAKQDSRVFIAGTFNNWNPSTHPLEYHPESGVFRATLLLEPGVHEYKFVVDGVWHADAKCPHWVINDSGTINSVIRV